jgi:hypothetical protein
MGNFERILLCSRGTFRTPHDQKGVVSQRFLLQSVFKALTLAQVPGLSLFCAKDAKQAEGGGILFTTKNEKTK